MPWEIAIAAFGIAAATLLVGGAILLRYQRDRQHFLLMQAALDKGITSFPGMVPGWLISLRIGVLCLVLGLGLTGGGIAFYQAANFIDQPPTQSAAEVPLPPGYGGGPPPQSGPPRDQAPNPPPTGRPNDEPPTDHPPGRSTDGRPPAPPPPRQPMQTPALERWHLIQTQHTGGLIAICVGAILALLGIARIAFARIERHYTTDPVPTHRTMTPDPGNLSSNK